jgi:hypothetical protein
LTIKPEQAITFFRLMDQRYNRVSTIITTNLDLPERYGCSTRSRCRRVDRPIAAPLHHHPHRRPIPAKPRSRGAADQPEAANHPSLIGLDVPADDDRRVVLALVKVRCSPCSL